MKNTKAILMKEIEKLSDEEAVKVLHYINSLKAGNKNRKNHR